MQTFYCVLSLFLIIFDSTARAVPLRYRRAFSYIANETACTVDHIVYKDGDPIPTDDPCESCKCRPPGFSCVLRECEVKTGCKAIRRAGECCPQYQCGCEHNGNYYGDGDRIPNAESPCYSCYCQGSSITCSLADCKFRFDCEPEYILGECCPRYDHCPPENIPTSVTVKSTVVPILTTLFTTTPMPTTPSTTSAAPLTTFTTTPSTTLSTTPSTTSTTPSTTSTTTTTTTISPSTTSPTTINVPTTTTTSTTISPSITTVPIITLPSDLPPITEKEVTTTQSASSESQTTAPTEIITESTNISLPELTSPPTTELVESPSTEYSTTNVSKELSESKTTTEYSTNAQTIGSGIESTTLNIGDITSIDIQTSSPLYEMTVIPETTTERLKTDQKVNQSVTDLIPTEIVSEVSLETTPTPNVIILEPEVTTILPEIVKNISETTTELNSESISNEMTISLVTKPIVSEEITTKGSVEDINTVTKLTTQSIGIVEEITSKPDLDQEIRPIESTTQSNANPPQTEIIESIDTNNELVPIESTSETTTQTTNFEYNKTEIILATTEVIKSEETKKESEVTTTEKSTEVPQKEIVVTQTIISETTTPSQKVYETTLRIEDLKPEENPTESDISSDAMIEMATMDPTLVKSEELSVSSSSESSTSHKFTISAVVVDITEEITTKEPLITTSSPIVLSDENIITTKTVSNEELTISDNTKTQESTTRLSEDKSESINTEKPKYGEGVEEAVTQPLVTTTFSSKVSAETKDEITTESVTEVNVIERQTIRPQNTTIKSNEVNIETTTQMIATETLSTNPSSESIALVSNEESSPQTTTISDILNNIRTETNTNESTIDPIIETTTTSSKQLLELNTESMSYSNDERGSDVLTSDMN